MATRKAPFSKKTSTTYALVNRPQNDPLVHDDEAPSHVFTQISGPSSSRQDSDHERKRNPKIKQRGDLEAEFRLSEAVRANEGEAAGYGIFYDDSGYDYMQHLKQLGEDSGGLGSEVAWVEAPQAMQREKKGKGQRLEDALKDIRLNNEGSAQSSALLEEDDGRDLKASYQDQQDIPDALAGFQPDMDPRLREALEALEDEDYVDDDHDIFEELAGKGKAEEVDRDEWEATSYHIADDEEGWESDDTTRPEQGQGFEAEIATTAIIGDISEQPQQSGSNNDRFTSFARADNGTRDNTRTSPTDVPCQLNDSSIAPSDASALTTRTKRRKGALTSSTGFSMTSSSLARTDALNTLDSRFEKLAASYMTDINEEVEEDPDDATSVVTETSTATGKGSRWGASSMVGSLSIVGLESDGDEAPPLTSVKVTSVVDEFLNSAGGAKGRRMKKGGRPGVWGAQSGMDQLDEIRKGLGPARLGSKRQQGVPV